MRARSTVAHGWRAAAAMSAAVALSALACDGGSPTAPAPAPGASGLTVIFTDASAALAARGDEIRSHLELAYTRASGALAIAGVVAEVNARPQRIIPGWGVGGFALGPGRIEIAVDPALSAPALAARLPPITSHELHHVARIRGPGYGATLLEAMVSEGLADHFALDQHGGAPPPWTMALSADDVETWLERARPEFDSTTYDFEAWFFGDGEIPRWTGYTLGFEIVAAYLAAHPEASAASLVDTPAEAFRPD